MLIDDLKGIEFRGGPSGPIYRSCTRCPELLGDGTDCRGNCVDATLRYIANRLTEQGYVKVVRCGECKHWSQVKGRDEGWCDALEVLLTADMPYTKAGFCCSEGKLK